MDDATTKNLLRSLPQIEEVLKTPQVQELLKSYPHGLIADQTRLSVDRLRQRILGGEQLSLDLDVLVQDVCDSLDKLVAPSLKRVINATGVIMHTNLGRSNLASSAISAVNAVIEGYSTLEYDTDTRSRGSRHSHCEELLCTLTGAEAALAVNNNAAAVLLVLSEFAAEHEVIVSRGELVEIGGSFRIPDIIKQSHAHMIEVGTTNKTHSKDYKAAMGEDTAVLLKVHPSNFRMLGFTENVDIAGLRLLADEENARRLSTKSLYGEDAEQQDVLVYEDQGSGALLKLDCFGTYHEPTVRESLEHGADLISFSGDKLLGGPQAGIIVGKSELIARLKQNPLVRALRLDKMTLAALHATLQLYLNPDTALEDIPTLRMLSLSAETVKAEALKLEKQLKDSIESSYASFTVEPEIARAGGGSLPLCDIDSYVLAVGFNKGSALKCEEYLVQKRSIPIIARIKQDRLLFDPRTLVDESERDEIIEALKAYFGSL